MDPTTQASTEAPEPSINEYAARALLLQNGQSWEDEQIVELFMTELRNAGMEEVTAQNFLGGVQEELRNRQLRLRPEGLTRHAESVNEGYEETPRTDGTPAGISGVAAPPPREDRRLDLLEQILLRLAENQGSKNGRRARIADPDYFDGDRKDYRRFRTVMSYKLTEDRDSLGNIPGYIMSRLSGKASIAGITYIRHYPKCTEAEFWAMLDDSFLDRQAAEFARNKLLTMRQGNRRLQDFNLDFNNCALEGGENNDQTLKNLYSLAIKPELSELLVTVDEDETWSLKKFQDKVVRMEEKQYRLKMRKAMWAPKKTSGEEMDWEPTKANAGRIDNRPRPGRRNFSSPDKNKNTQGRTRAAWLPASEIEKRRKEGLCFRCGRDGHRSNQCKLLPAEKPAHVRVASSRPEDNASGDERVESASDSEN